MDSYWVNVAICFVGVATAAVGRIDKNQKRKKKTIVDQIKNLVAKFHSDPRNGVCTFMYTEENTIEYLGNESFNCVVREHEDIVQTHPDFINISSEVSLPEPPIMNKSFKYAKSKKCVGDLLKLLLPKQAGYGDPTMKPSWWVGPWLSIYDSHGHWRRDDYVRLIIAIYNHYGTSSDELNYVMFEENPADMVTSVTSAEASTSMTVDVVSPVDLEEVPSSPSPPIAEVSEPLNSEVVGESSAMVAQTNGVVQPDVVQPVNIETTNGEYSVPYTYNPTADKLTLIRELCFKQL